MSERNPGLDGFYPPNGLKLNTNGPGYIDRKGNNVWEDGTPVPHPVERDGYTAQEDHLEHLRTLPRDLASEKIVKDIMRRSIYTKT